jgi:hypothetical protein
MDLYWLGSTDTTHGHDALFAIASSSSLTAAFALSAVVANLF